VSSYSKVAIVAEETLDIVLRHGLVHVYERKPVFRDQAFGQNGETALFSAKLLGEW
jgi:hypothetical protein